MTLAVLCAAGGVAAQTPPAQVPQGSPIPRLLPTPAPATAPGLQVTPARPANLADPSAVVTVNTVAVEGANRYGADGFAGVLAALKGKVKVADIDAARRAIVDRYRGDGFILTAVNAALDAQGRLRFVVTEGHIAEVKLDGDIGPAGTQVLRFLNRLTEFSPIDAATLERYLLLAQDVPGVTVRAVLRPSTQEPGALTLVAQVSRSMLSGLLTADNRGAPFTGPEAALALLSVNSLTEYGERTEVSLFRAFNGTQIFGQVATDFFVGSDGTKIRIFGGSGTADPSGTLRATGYHGPTTVGGVSVTYPYIRTRQQKLNVGAYFDILESHIDTGNEPTVQQASRDNIRALRIGADYALQDNALGAGRPAVNALTFRVSQGLPILGANPANDPKAGRQQQQANDWLKFSSEISRTQTLYQFGEISSIAFQATLAGQYTRDVLPSAEEFFLGGARLNRGYYSGEVTGDSGLSVALEMQFNTAFTTDITGKSIDLDTQFYGFFDWGQSYMNRPTDANRRLESVGVGTRITIARATELGLEVVNRLVLNPQGASSTTAKLSPYAAYWRVLTRL